LLVRTGTWKILHWKMFASNLAVA